MPNRDFDTCTWTDPWVETLSPMQKLLFFYCWTNNHCTPSGIYHISYKRISDEIGLSEKQIRELLPTLHPKVMYDDSFQLLWVRNFVRKQRRGEKFLIGAIRSLEKLKPHKFILMLLEENQGLLIASDSLSKALIAPISGSGGIDVDLDVKKGMQGETKTPPPKKEKAKGKTRLPDDFSISDRVRAWAEEKKYTQLESHLENFKLTAESKEYEYANWDSAFMRAIRDNWARIGEKNNGSQNGGGERSRISFAEQREREQKQKYDRILGRSPSVSGDVHREAARNGRSGTVDSTAVEVSEVED